MAATNDDRASREAACIGGGERVDVTGHGPPLLCLPGFGSANWIFERWIPTLERRFTLVMPDNRGMGRSPPAVAPYGIGDLARDALEVMTRLGFERFGLVGLSMGGFIAQRLVLDAPQRVTAMALLGTTSGGPEFARHFPVMGEEQLRGIYQMKAAARARAALDPALVPYLHSHYPEVFDYLLERRAGRDEALDQILLQYRAVTEFLQHPLPLERIACPTLVLAGEQDLLVPLENGRLLAARIPGARLTVLPVTDHLFFLEDLAGVTGALTDFFFDTP
ncbi:MAG: alpha/beta hydrolase [Magnetococcales bacterium]|nr:alpha/beta hydrolase [Magnetococcales bacterium]